MLAIDKHQSISWVNQDLQEVRELPPNVEELKEEFQKLRREHIRQANQQQREPQKNLAVPSVRQSKETEENLKAVQASRGSSEQTPNYQIAEPRQTHESSQGRIDPRQALFQSNQNTASSKNPDAIQNDSNHLVFTELQKEINEFKKRMQELEHENNELRLTNNELTQENIRLSQTAPNSGAQLKASSNRASNQAEAEAADWGGTGTSKLEEELKTIHKMLKEVLSQNPSGESAERRPEPQKPPAPNTSAVSRANLLQPPPAHKPDPLVRSQSQNYEPVNQYEFKKTESDSRNLSEALPKQKNLATESNKTSGEPQITGQSRSESTSQNGQEQIDRQEYHGMKTSSFAYQGLSVVSLGIYHKWKDILTLEWKILSETESKLHDERRLLRQRKQVVKQYEWDLLWSLQNSAEENLADRAVQNIKSMVFQFELDSEKQLLLAELYEKRVKKLRAIEKTLSAAMKAHRLGLQTDTQLAMMFNQYIDLANLYEYKHRINTQALNPYKPRPIPAMTSQLPYTTSAKLDSLSGTFAKHTGKLGHSKPFPQASAEFDESLSNTEFLQKAIERFRESVLPDWTVYQDIARYFENEAAWYSLLKEEVKQAIRQLRNPTNISTLGKTIN